MAVTYCLAASLPVCSIVADTALIWADHCMSPTAKTAFQKKCLQQAWAGGTPTAVADAAIETDLGRIYCISDLHTDHAANMEWCRALQQEGDKYASDVLIEAPSLAERNDFALEDLLCGAQGVPRVAREAGR